MRVLAMRVMMTGSSDGKITRAVLQHQIEDGSVSDGTYRCVWEDVRELPITADGRVVLGTIPESRETTLGTSVAPDALSKYAKPVDVPQAFYEAFRDGELEL